jgi:hypothetical protein
MKRKRKKRIGNRKTPGSRLIALLALVCVGAGLSTAGGKKKPLESYAIVAGTVFREPGFALPEANVILMLKGDPKAKKLQQAVTSPRGEFAFRVPPSPATYIVKAVLKGFHPEEKEASVSGEERIEVTFVLAPESK